MARHFQVYCRADKDDDSSNKLSREDIVKAYFHLLAGLILLIVSNAAQAQSYPNKSVRIIVPAMAGGPSDLMGRILAQKMSETWGQQFIVENIPTGAGNVALGIAAKAPPDGYTMVTPTSSIVVNPSLYAKLPYDIIADFTPVTMAAASPHAITVNPSVPAKTVMELIALVKANPGKYSYASPGTGTTGQLAGEWFKISHGLDLVHVPFNGGAPAATSTIGGHTPIMFSALPTVGAAIRGGQLRALAVTSGKRSPDFPDVPTLAEAGVPNQESEFIQAVLVPAGTPKEIVNQLYREVARIVALPDVKERLRAIGYVPVGNTPEEFAAQIRTEIAKWEKVIREANIKKIE
jgi:tripartite-type tricarboxylate transporter receptor subunit TctC